MKRWTAVLLALGALSASTAKADELSGMEWARPGDAAACAAGDVVACARLNWTYYVLPRVVKELRKYLQIPVIDWNKPQPDPIPVDVVKLRDQLKQSLAQNVDVKAVSKVQIEQLAQFEDILISAADNIRKDREQLQSAVKGK